MFQNKHIAQWALYMTICIFVLTACKNEKVIQDKRKDTKTSESTALPCEQSYIDWNNSVARKNEKLYFAIEIKDFIDAYNYCYYQDYGKKYIQSLVTWYSYKQDFGRLKGDMCYEYTENKKILTLPTVAVYTIKHTKNIEAITVNFDDHSYTEKMYKKYEKLCFYCLKMLFPNMEKNKISKEIDGFIKEIDETITDKEKKINNKDNQNISVEEMYKENGIDISKEDTRSQYRIDNKADKIIDGINMEDKKIVCKDCKKEFIFVAGEQEFYKAKGYEEPVRCKECRVKKKERYNEKK